MGIADNTKLGVKAYISSGTGFQVGVKHQFFEKGSTYSAFQVSGHAMFGVLQETSEDHFSVEYTNRDQADVYGFELRYLLSSQPAGHFYSTISPHLTF